MNITSEESAYNEATQDNIVTWQIFCENCAKFAAIEFAVQCRAFVAENPVSTQGIAANEFGKKFLEYFSKHFDALTITRPKFGDQNGNASSGSRNRAPMLRSIARPNTVDFSRNFTSDDSESSNKNEIISNEAKKDKGKKMFRHLSFRVLRDSAAGRTLRNLFRQTSAEEVLTSENGKEKERNSAKNSKAKLKIEKQLTIKREVDKEGILNLLMAPDDYDGSPQWERCKTLLIKQGGNMLLEFYIPVKASKPRSTLICSSIIEAREATTLEMPDHFNTFVVKGEDNVEYVLEAPDFPEMQMWLLAIQASMKPTDHSSTGQVGSNLQLTQSNSHLSLSNEGADGTIGSDTFPPEIPPRTPTRLGALRGQQASISTSSNALDLPTEYQGDTAMDRVLAEYPWFHGMLLRMEAAQLVLQQGVDGHGVFLVRQSETRLGEYVLTFNFQGRAKHLRMTLEPNGRCRVHHLWFPTVFEMLEHFRSHPIPLETGGCTDIMLTEYVICRPRLMQQQNRAHSTGNINSASASPLTAGIHNRQSMVMSNDMLPTHGGSVRLRIQSLENIGVPLSLNSGRAVENPYSFV